MKTRTSPAGLPAANRGFTFVVVLAAVVVLAIGAQVAIPMASRVAKIDREQELLFRGLAYRRAIASYFDAGAETASGRNTYPGRLDDLLNDPRFAHRRHLRRLYEHPIDEREWVVLRNADGRIVGVASPSEQTPLKQAGFPSSIGSFEKAESYRQWEFVHHPAGDANDGAKLVNR